MEQGEKVVKGSLGRETESERKMGISIQDREGRRIVAAYRNDGQ